MPRLLLAALALGGAARADESSGTYSGSVAARGNYYFERSTRVVAPAVSASLAGPRGTHVDGAYLIDAITSASQATGVQSDVSFTELRHDVSLGVGKPFALPRGAELDATLLGRLSTEPDYLSRGAGFSSSLSLAQRNTTLRLSGYFVHDEVSRVERMAPATSPDRLVASKPVRVGTLDALSLGAAYDQVLSPNRVLTLGFDFAHLEGVQQNVYRVVAFADGGGSPESHPRVRNRYAPYLWAAQYIPNTRSSLRVGYRYYQDSWEILAHSPEARVYQEVGDYLELRARYRYYRQTGSYFFRESQNLRSDEYITADPKMTAFHSHTVGLKVRLALELLSFTVLDFAHRAVLDFGVDYVLNTNRYGDGIIAQGGLLWPF